MALLLKNFPAKAMISWTPISSQIMTARFLGSHAKLSHVACYASTNEACTEDKNSFYNELVGDFKDIPRHDVLCLLGDLNAKVGNDYNICPEATVLLKLKKHTGRCPLPAKPLFASAKLKEKEMKTLFSVKLSNKFETLDLPEDADCETIWENMKSCFQEVAESTIGTVRN